MRNSYEFRIFQKIYAMNENHRDISRYFIPIGIRGYSPSYTLQYTANMPNGNT